MRKKKSFYNMISSLGTYFVSIVANFVTQAFIIKILGIQYSGVNGLFTNILTMLSIAELGVGTTIVFKLYKPVAMGKKESIKSWMKFYKQCYSVIAMIVLIVGLLLIPFVPLIVGKTSITENIIILYLLSLMDTVISYIMTYKRSILYADQKTYIINIVHMLYMFFMNLTQIIVLYATKNYIFFLIIKIIWRVIENLLINIYVNRKYPYILENSSSISKKEKKDVFDRIKAIVLQKISFIINKGIDSITISYFLGISMAGYYANYNMIVIGVTGIIFQLISSLMPSVGNLLTEENIEKNYQIYKKINMLNSFVTGICIVLFASLVQPFVTLWIGKKYLLNIYIVVCFCLYIYSDSIRRSITIFKEAAGICKEDRYMYVIMAVINLVLSIILCKIIGIAGVILGTSISYLFLITYSYPKYIFKPIFKKSMALYYKENLKYFSLMFESLILTLFLVYYVNMENYFIQLIINGLISSFIFTFLFIAFYHDSDEFKYYINTLKKYSKIDR